MIYTHKNEYHLITCLNLFYNFSQKYTIFIFFFHVTIKHILSIPTVTLLCSMWLINIMP